jgi:hypothetical protein
MKGVNLLLQMNLELPNTIFPYSNVVAVYIDDSGCRRCIPLTNPQLVMDPRVVQVIVAKAVQCDPATVTFTDGRYLGLIGGLR